MEEIKIQPYDVAGRRPEDYIYGANEKIVKVKLFDSLDKIKYLPQGERQKGKLFDDYGCVSRHILDALEILFKRLIELNRITPENLKWLKDEGYYVNGEINFSDRFLVVLSNTTPRVGNSAAVVIQYARDLGLAPQTLCDWNGEGTEAEYYDKSTISQKAKDTALEFKKRFNIQYEWARETEWDDESQYGCLEFFTYAWFKDGTKYYNPNPGKANHAVTEANLKDIKIFDSYEPFIKQMTKRTDLQDFAMAVFVSDRTYKENMSNVKIVKDTNSKTVYMALPVADEKAFESYCQNYGIEIKKHGDYTINWKEMLNGSINIV